MRKVTLTDEQAFKIYEACQHNRHIEDAEYWLHQHREVKTSGIPDNICELVAKRLDDHYQTDLTYDENMDSAFEYWIDLSHSGITATSEGWREYTVEIE